MKKKNMLVAGLIICFQIVITNSFSQGTWTPKSDFGGASRHMAVGFSIGSKGYIGTGSGVSNEKDFWEFDPTTNVWTQKADFGGTARYCAVGFSIGTKGYIGTGWDGAMTKDFWEFDPTTNVWTQKADFGGTARWGAAGFSLMTTNGNKGYIGMGTDAIVGYTKDYWEYNPDTDTWTQIADFGGTPRYGSGCFSIGSNGYVCAGFDGTSKQDLWMYEATSNQWIQKSNFVNSRFFPVGFAIGTKGYVGTGSYSGVYQKDLWEYDPSTDTWTQKSDFSGTERWMALGFSIGTKGYIGTGFDQNLADTTDFWEYNPIVTDLSESTKDIGTIVILQLTNSHFIINSKYNLEEITIFDLSNKQVMKIDAQQEKSINVNIDQLRKGIYIIHVKSELMAKSFKVVKF